MVEKQPRKQRTIRWGKGVSKEKVVPRIVVFDGGERGSAGRRRPALTVLGAVQPSLDLRVELRELPFSSSLHRLAVRDVHGSVGLRKGVAR
jgi:hypothetical protein